MFASETTALSLCKPKTMVTVQENAQTR